MSVLTARSASLAATLPLSCSWSCKTSQIQNAPPFLKNNPVVWLTFATTIGNHRAAPDIVSPFALKTVIVGVSLDYRQLAVNPARRTWRNPTIHFSLVAVSVTGMNSEDERSGCRVNQRAAEAGKCNVKLEPSASTLSNVMRPPCCSAISFTSGSPRPVPTIVELASRSKR